MYPPRLRGLLTLIFALMLLCFPHGVQALRTSGNFTRNRTIRDAAKDFTEGRFLDYYKSKFGFTSKGVFNATIEISATIKGGNGNNSINQDEFAASYRIAFCDVTKKVVRDSSYQMKRVVLLDDPAWREKMRKQVCSDRRSERPQCWSQPLNRSGNIFVRADDIFSPSKNRIILISLNGCTAPMRKALRQSRKVTTRIRYTVSMRNLDARFPELGWEEAVYPYSAPVITAFAITAFISVITASVISHTKGRGVHSVLKVLLCTSAIKIISSSLTAGAFWRASASGKFMIWFFVLRVPLIIIDEILIGLLMLVMSTGIGMIPHSWLFDRRSSTFAVFLGLALELFTVVTSEVVFAYKYLGLIVFLFSGGTVACIGILFSWKNSRFVAKYAKLVRMANIVVETTPLLRMRLFFNVNAGLVLGLWLFKIITFGIMDHVLFRPDLLWTCLEAADITLLVWYAFSVFPRRKSAFYVDMSNVDNVRLREVSAWHVRQEQQRREDQNSSANGDEVNAVGTAPASSVTAVAGALPLGEARDNVHSTSIDSVQLGVMLEDDPEPEWISWESGMTLPVPTTGMWNFNDDVRRVLRRQRPLECPETMVRVLGSRMDSPDSLSLTIAKPIIGPDAPKRQGRGISGSPEALIRDRDDPIGADEESNGVGIRMRQSAPRGRIVVDDENGTEISPMDADGDRDSATPSRRAVPSFVEYTDSEMFSVPSSNASADGEIFSEHSGLGKQRP